jgi:hypothetical protein
MNRSAILLTVTRTTEQLVPITQNQLQRKNKEFGFTSSEPLSLDTAVLQITGLHALLPSGKENEVGLCHMSPKMPTAENI